MRRHLKATNCPNRSIHPKFTPSSHTVGGTTALTLSRDDVNVIEYLRSEGDGPGPTECAGRSRFMPLAAHTLCFQRGSTRLSADRRQGRRAAVEPGDPVQ